MASIVARFHHVVYKLHKTRLHSWYRTSASCSPTRCNISTYQTIAWSFRVSKWSLIFFWNSYVQTEIYYSPKVIVTTNSWQSTPRMTIPITIKVYSEVYVSRWKWRNYRSRGQLVASLITTSTCCVCLLYTGSIHWKQQRSYTTLHCPTSFWFWMSFFMNFVTLLLLWPWLNCLSQYMCCLTLPVAVTILSTPCSVLPRAEHYS